MSFQKKIREVIFTKYRNLILAIFVTVLIVESFAFWSAYKPYHLLSSVLAGAGILLQITLLTTLLLGRKDWLFRGLFLAITLSYIIYELFTLWQFFTQVD